MKRKRLIAIAPCSFSLPAAPTDNLVSLQVTPAGRFFPSDGRELNVPGWYIDADIAQRVIERFNARQTPLVLDYEHQTLNKDENGQPAPAAGWWKSLEWRDGSGLWATIELTSRARDFVTNGEYRYFSPVFAYHRRTGEVQDVHMGALTNTPAIDGMEAIALRAAATFGINQETEEDPVNELLKMLLTAMGLAHDVEEDKALTALNASLGLEDDAGEEQVVAALSARLQKDPLADLRKALSLDENADDQAVVTACTALKAKAAAGPDPAKYVPIGTVDGLKHEITALSARVKASEEKDVDAMIESALEDGRLVKPLESWARDLAKKDVAALTAYLGAAKPLAALKGSQTRGEAPADDKTGLTQDELAVCSRMGITADQYKAAKED